MHFFVFFLELDILYKIIFPCRKKLKDGEAGFLQGCAMVNDELVSASSSSRGSLPQTLTSAQEIGEVFGDKQLKELEFNAQKQSKAQIEEALLGVMNPEEITDAVRALARTTAEKLAKTQRERNNDQRLVQKKVSSKGVSRI